MSFDVKTEFRGMDPEAQRALVEMQRAIRRAFDDQDKKNARPKRSVTELVQEGAVIARPGEVVRVQPGDEDIEVVLPPSDPGNGGQDIIVSFEGDGTATGKVLVTSMSGTCTNPGQTTLNTPGSYRFTSTGAPSEGEFAQDAAWSGPAPVGLEDLPELAPQRLLGNNTGAAAPPTELTASQVLDWVDSTRGTIPYRGAAAWAGLDPGAIELPLVSKGAAADPVYQQLATAGIQDDAVTNAKAANMVQATIKLRAAAAGTGDPTDGTITNALDMAGSTRGSLLERGAASWGVITPGTSGLPLVSAGAGADPAYTALTTTGLAAAAAKSVLVNATNSSAVPAYLAGTAAFQYLRVNSANNALEWATLSNHASTSLLYASDTWQRAALTGEVTAAQNVNALVVTRSTDFQTTPWTGSHQFNANVRLNGTFEVRGRNDLTLSADADDVDMTTFNVLRIVGNGFRLTGMIALSPGNGQTVQIFNADSADPLIIGDQDTASAAANRIACPGNADFALAPRSGVWAKYDDTANLWFLLANTATGQLVAYTEYNTGSSNHTYDERTTYAIRELTGGGGAGGGTIGGAGSSAGGGGQAGATRRTAGAVTPGSTAAYSVGAAGTGSSGASGGNGANSTMDASTTGLGGQGGGVGTNATTNNVAAGGGDNVTGSQGSPGESGFAVAEDVVSISCPGKGGDGPDGGGGWAHPQAGTGAGTGAVGRLTGSGGAGSYNVGTAGNRAGGAGVIGRIRVWEFS